MIKSETFMIYLEEIASKPRKPQQAEVHIDDKEFDYILKREKQDKICFLSGSDRYPKIPKLPVTANATYLAPEKCSGVTALLTKVRSRRGVGGLANLSPRFQKMRLDDTPGPTKYNTELQKKTKPLKYPFTNTKGEYKVILNTNPGPGTYDEPTQCRRPLKKYNFGAKTRMIPCVEAICYPFPSDKCIICYSNCTGDYWHLDYSTFICLICMRLEKRLNSKFSCKELKKFQKTRNCAYMHQHEGTTAAIRLLTNKDLCTKFRKENYLENYFNKYY